MTSVVVILFRRDLDWLPTNGQLELGIRYHEDQEDRLQHEDGYQMLAGRMIPSSRGAAGGQSNRVNDAEAWAVYLQDRIEWGRASLTPGLRLEKIELVRTDFARTDPERIDPLPARRNDLAVAIPGIGLELALAGRLELLAGVHRGFSPPGPGSAEDTEAEQSVNWELGLQTDGGSFDAQVVGFLSRYGNLLGADSLASGGTGEGDQFNGGRVRVRGLEASLGSELALG